MGKIAAAQVKVETLVPEEHTIETLEKDGFFEVRYDHSIILMPQAYRGLWERWING